MPDGLAAGRIDTQALTRGWTHAEAPRSSTENGRTTVTINQTADRAILNWQTFNVGRDTTVDFRQQAEWAVLNRVNDPAGRPSQIQGQIKAPGTVLIVNRNGVVFDGASQVNVRNLVAARQDQRRAVPRARAVWRAGTEPSFTDALGKVEVRPGARIDARAGQRHAGRRLRAAAGRRGAQRRRDQHAARAGAAAAGDSFIIRRGVGTSENTLSTTRATRSRRAWRRTRMAAWRNTGLIVAAEGDVTLAGRQVRQEGVALATTTTRTRGTIHLLNSASDAKGSIVLAPESVTAVLIDDDGSTALDSQRNALIKESAEQDLLRYRQAPGAFDNLSRLSDRRDQSRIEIVSGGDIQFQGGSLALATAGRSRPRRARASWRRAPSWTWPARWACGSRWRPTASRSTCRATSCATRPTTATRPSCSTASCGWTGAA